MKRIFDPSQPELMDLAELIQGTPSPELERDLRNLRWINKHFGATALLHHFLARWFRHRNKTESLRILDLATGEGDLPRTIIQWCRKRGLSMCVDAVDLNPATLAVARMQSTEFPEITFHQGDIRSWGDDRTEESAPYDLVLCSLALHHFSNADAVAVLHNARRLASRHLLVADLDRTRMGAFGIWLLTAILIREPMTVHDARLSIRRAFSFSEFRSLAQEAGWETFSHARFPVTRQALWMDQV